MNPEIDIWTQAWSTWEKGGSLMLPLFLLSLYAYFVAFELLFRLRRMMPTEIRKASPSDLVEKQEAIGGALGEAIRHCLSTGKNREETRRRFQQIRSETARTLNRRIRFLLALVSAAPLLGLLGTVDGMLATFRGLTLELGRKMDLVSGGISEALVTTQAGLLIAIPAYVLLHLVSRRRSEWLRLLRLLESHAIRQMASRESTSNEIA